MTYRLKMDLIDIWMLGMIVSTGMEIVTSQFSNLPNTITVPENTPGATRVYSIIIDLPFVFHFNYDIEYEPPNTSDQFLVINTPNGFDVTVRPGAMLNFETPPNQYRISVLDLLGTEGSGEGTLELPAQVVKRQADPNNIGIGVLEINITDVEEPPKFDNTKYFVSVEESNTPMDPYILLPSPAFDEDLNDTISYELDAIYPDNEAIPFDINRTTGNIKLVGEYDVDGNNNPDVLIITIRAVDSFGLSNTTTLFVTIEDINDNDPVFTGTGNYVILLPYDYAEMVKTEIGYVHADDADGNDRVTYNLATRNIFFGVDSSTGIIRLVSPLPVSETNSGVFHFAINASSAPKSKQVIANVAVYIVPFCAVDKESGCDLCNESSSYTPGAELTALESGRLNPRKQVTEVSNVNTCPKTMCSKCRDYITDTCSSGTVSLSSESKACSEQNKNVTTANFQICWILPLVIAVALATLIITCCLYTRQKKMKKTSPVHDVHNKAKPNIITVETTA